MRGAEQELIDVDEVFLVCGVQLKVDIDEKGFRKNKHAR